MRRRATIKDVAALAGVSLKTVSRVINGEGGVSPRLAGRVDGAVRQLDYRHNLAASNLRRGRRTASIGVLLHDLRNAYSATLLRAIEDQARHRGVAVFSASLDNEDAREAALAADLVSRRVDGLVLMPTSADQSHLLPDIRAGLAVVAVDRIAQGVDVDTVLTDNVGGAAAATRHLAAAGHRHIACLTDRETIWTSAQRSAGYRQGLALADLPFRPELAVAGLESEEDSAVAVATLMSGPLPPTALFAARNTLAIGAVRALHRAGLHHRVALVGFDDFPLSDVVSPAVTVVAQDLEAIGAHVADLLFRRMDGSAAEPTRVVLPAALVVRGSGELPGGGAVDRPGAAVPVTR